MRSGYIRYISEREDATRLTPLTLQELPMYAYSQAIPSVVDQYESKVKELEAQGKLAGKLKFLANNCIEQLRLTACNSEREFRDLEYIMSLAK